MQANDVNFQTVFGAFQYKIPYFQRSYVWKKEQIVKFQEDMFHVSEEYKRYLIVQQKYEYFMGTIISKSIPTNTAYTINDLIDGQQRVTTFAIFFKVMSLVYNNPNIFKNSFEFSIGFPSQQFIFKLQSSAVDQPIIDKIINNNVNCALDKDGNQVPVNKKWNKRNMHPLYVAYNMFRDYLEELKSQGKYVIPDYIINGVKFINMTLVNNDDPQVYFDNINSLGVRLTTGAIIKNYIFADNASGYNDYKNMWEPVFEGSNFKYWNGDGNRTNIDEFLFYFLQVLTYDTARPVSTQDKTLYSRRDAVANHLKELCENYMRKQKRILLNELLSYADIYSKIVLEDIGTCTSLGNNQTVDDKLARIGYLVKKLKATTIIPYLLFMVNKNANNTRDTIEILDYLESYLIRRSLTNMSADNFNKFFREVLIGRNVLTLQALKQELNPSNNRTTDMPDDLYILSNLGNVDYQGDNETPKALLYLYEHELSKRNNSQTALFAPNSYTLEHLMPQTLCSTYWPGPNQSDDHIYKFGNMGLLTQSLQSIIKNRSWNDKLNGYQGKPGIASCCGGLYTMQDVINKTVWNDTEIDTRTKQLVSDIISIWKS